MAKKKTQSSLFNTQSESQISSQVDEIIKPSNTEVIINDEGRPELITYTGKEIKISQSLMKSVRSYLEGGDCGVLLKEQWINGRGDLSEATKAMKLGIYFEYILTGSLPKSGVRPEPEYMKSEINKNLKAKRDPLHGLGINEMYELYREAHANKKYVEELWAKMGLEIAKDKNGKPISGWKVTKGRFEGTIDVVLRATRDIEFADGFKLKEGDLISNDLKYSGLRDDRWSVHGWQWTPDQKRYHGTQGKQYKFLTDLEQFFWVVDPKGKYVLFFRCEIDQLAIDAHVAEGNELLKRLLELNEMDMLEPRPEVNKCADCALFSECAYRHEFPHPVRVDLTLDGK